MAGGGQRGDPPLSYRPRFSPSSSSARGWMKPCSSQHCEEEEEEEEDGEWGGGVMYPQPCSPPRLPPHLFQLGKLR